MLTIKNNQAPSAKHNPKLGDFYGRFDDDKALYLVTRHISGDSGFTRYGLINLSTGNTYSDDKMFIGEIFGHNSDKFYLITKDIRIIVD